jgi:hypothetical protein
MNRGTRVCVGTRAHYNMNEWAAARAVGAPLRLIVR